MAKLQSFSDFSTFRNTQAKIKLEEEKDTKRNVSAEAFKSMLSDFQVTSIKELDEDQRIEFFTKLKEAGINESVTLIEEGTRGQIGKIDKRGNITSVYMHYDSYPENVLPLIKKTYSKGGSPLNMILKNGDNSGLESDPSGMNYYGDFTASKGKISNVSKYLRDVADGGGAEFVYLWDEANKEWLMADIYGKGYDDVYPAFESLLVIEAISVQYKRDAKKVLTVYKNLFGKKLTDFGAMGKEDMLGCVKYLFEEAMTDANFHREKVISKNIKGRIGSFELKVPGLGNHFLKVGATTTKRILNKYYSDLANAAGWSGIGIVEGTALYLESIREEAMGQALLNAFNMFESKSNTGNLLNEARNKNILLNEASVVMDAMDPKSKTLKKLLKKYNVKMKILTMNGPGGGWPEVEMTGSREDLQSILADPNGWDDPELGEYIEESNISEARSINKISKEFGETVNKMKDIVKIYIAAEDGSDEKAKTRQQLIDLTAKKKALTNELDDAVAGKNKDVKLVITEGVMSDIHQMIGNHKTFDTFQKEFFKEYGHKKVMKKTPEFLAWLKALYNDFEYTSGEVVEEKYTKKSLLKKLGDADDAMIQTGNGKEYIIYNPDSNNDDNAAMWHAKSVFALDQDGEEHEIDYKDIGLVMVESAITEAKNDGNLDTIADYVKQVLDDGKSFMDIGKKLKGAYKYDFSTGMMPMYIIPVSGNKIVIINKKYVENGQADRVVGDIAIGLMESKIQIKRKYTDNHPAQTSGRTARVRNAMIEALADGVLTEEEFNNILKEKSIDNKRWMRRNSKYFTVSENGIGLSKFGKRILTGIKPVVSLTLESFVNEANYIKFKGKKVDISSLEMEDVDMKDYPDFSDAYFSYGEYSNGKEMTDEELSDFTDDNLDLANELAHDSLH